MSTLQVANLHFESTGNNRIQYSGSSTFYMVANGTQVLTLGPTGMTVNGAFTDSGGDLRGIPVNAQTSAYQIANTDMGRLVSITTGGVTVNGAVLTSGFVVSIYNNSGSSQTITSGTGVTMYLSGTATTGNRTLLQRGVATVICVAANTFVISGAGIS